MKFKCPKCGVIYNIDESLIPKTGAYGNCVKCKNRFYIEKPSKVQTEIQVRKSDDGDKTKIIICPNCDHVNVLFNSCAVCGMIFTQEEQEKLIMTI